MARASMRRPRCAALRKIALVAWPYGSPDQARCRQQSVQRPLAGESPGLRQPLDIYSYRNIVCQSCPIRGACRERHETRGREAGTATAGPAVRWPARAADVTRAPDGAQVAVRRRGCRPAVEHCPPGPCEASSATSRAGRRLSADLRFSRLRLASEAARLRGPWVRQRPCCARPGVPRALDPGAPEAATRAHPAPAKQQGR